jgi:hypothetical protein
LSSREEAERSSKVEDGNLKLETGNLKLETGNLKLETWPIQSTRSIRSIAQPVKKPGKERFLSANEKNVFCEKVFRDNLA